MQSIDSIEIGQCHPKLVLDFGRSGHWQARNFRLSADRIGAADLFDSCVAPPARYLLEMYRRIVDAGDSPQASLFLLNPLPLLSKDETLLLLAALRKLESEASLNGLVAVLSDKNNLPLAYLLPRSVIDDPRFLILLSCSDAALDATALGMLYSCVVSTRRLDISVKLENCNGFYGGTYLRPNEICCRNASEVLKTRWAATKARDDQARRDCRDAIPLFAFISHHAGDVLFATLAAHSTPGIFQGVAVHRDYAAICRQAGLPLALLEFEGPVAHRAGYRREDPDHFADVFPKLPSDRFYVYGRTSRDYNFSDHHLIDHYAFLLGAPLTVAAGLGGGRPLPGTPVVPGSAATRAAGTAAGTTGLRILMHFDAGWPLKIYPLEWQRALVDMLRRRGHTLTLLDAVIEIPGCRSARFESLARFDELLAEHDLIVGMDSFPAHYASLVRKTPTLCLFSSTHPVHSHTRVSPRYNFLSAQLDCAPCRAYQHCPRFGGEICRNFLAPDEVCRHTEMLLTASRGSSGAALAEPPPAKSNIPQRMPAFKNLPSAHLPQRLRSDPTTVLVDPMRIDYGRQRRRQRMTGALKSLLRGFGLLAEYFVAVRDQGFWRANALTWGYLMRVSGRIEKSDGP